MACEVSKMTDNLSPLLTSGLGNFVGLSILIMI